MADIGPHHAIARDTLMARSHLKSRAQRKRQLNRMMGMKIRRIRVAAGSRERLHQPEATPFPYQNAPASDSRYHDARLDGFPIHRARFKSQPATSRSANPTFGRGRAIPPVGPR